MVHGRFYQRDQLLLVSAKALGHKSGTQLQCKACQVYGLKLVHASGFAFTALIGGGTILSLGKTITTVVHYNVNHIQVTAYGVHKLSHTYTGGITVTTHAKVDQVAVGKIC